MALPASDRDLASEQSSLHCLPISFSDLFLACIPRKRTEHGHAKKVRFAGRGQGTHKSSPKSIFALATNEKSNRCSHTTTLPATKCTCTCSSPSRPTSTSSANTLTPSSDNQATPYPDTEPTLDPTTIVERTRTSIRIVPSDTSSDYNSSSSLTSASSVDGYSISDYECRCGGSGTESVSDYDCTCSWDEFDYGYCYGEEKDRQVTGSMRPLPPLPGSGQGQGRKGEIKTRLIEETIREEDEDEYLAQQASEQEKTQKAEEEKKAEKHRRKSMIELLHLASLSSSNPLESRPVSTSSGLSLSFSNLHFRFPLPPFASPNKNSSKEKDVTDKTGKKQTETETETRFERKRPMSTSALVIPSGDLELNLGLGNRHTITAPSPLTLNPVSTDDFLDGITFPLISTSTSSSNEMSQSQTSLDLDCAPSPTIRLALSNCNTSTPTKTTTAPARTALPTKSPSPNTRKERRMGTILFPPSPLAMLSRSNIGDSNSDSSINGNVAGTGLALAYEFGISGEFSN
ncbi:hypothetical protein BDW69DRAFT_189531 [Aspergillus filifer]